MDLVLKFDEMDTTLAENYLQTKRVFKPIPISQGAHTNCKLAQITYPDLNFKYEVCLDSPYSNSSEIKTDNAMYTKLSQIIDNNFDLIIQLEYLIRGFLPKDTKNDIEMLKQCFTSSIEHCVDYQWTMADSSPLHTWASVVTAWKYNVKCYITASAKVAPICTLFSEMLYEAGFPECALTIKFFKTMKSNYGSSPFQRSVGIVTEYADIESAIDVLLSASSQYRSAWWLRHIIVQENVYESFKRALQFKARDIKARHISKERRTIRDYYYSCGGEPAPEGSRVDDRDSLFVLNHSGDMTGPINRIYVECYRTTKEMLALVNKYSPLYISLWCSHISTCNEIAYNVRANVSINQFGHFNSDFLYTMVEGLFYFKSYKDDQDILDILAAWNKNSMEERMLIIRKYLDMRNNEEFKKMCIERLTKFHPQNEIKVNANKIEVRLTMSNNVYYHNDLGSYHAPIYTLAVLLAILSGNGFVMPHADHKEWHFEAVKQLGIPIIFRDYNQKSIRYAETPFRYIWSTYGETFAN